MPPWLLARSWFRSGLLTTMLRLASSFTLIGRIAQPPLWRLHGLRMSGALLIAIEKCYNKELSDHAPIFIHLEDLSGCSG